MQPQSTLRRNRLDPQLHSPVKPALTNDRESTAARRIVCASCGHAITTERQRIEMAGRHEHRCVNPDGVIFHIGCFRYAPGCVIRGVPTTEFTWFPGYAWSYALCDGCATLLGWYYQSNDAAFFGLILNRLATTQ
ncbi:MAG TPA: cereblon family protein [Candidatus Margulisiibacteriota bacterium]|nr:cereblon family protein [Candidatus Margulisiibacteriota bacterium]